MINLMYKDGALVMMSGVPDSVESVVLEIGAKPLVRHGAYLKSSDGGRISVALFLPLGLRPTAQDAKALGDWYRARKAS